MTVMLNRIALVVVVASVSLAAQEPRSLDRAAERWVQDTFKAMTVEEKVGQMIVSSFQSNYTST
jgi:hypothetical protein